MLNQWAQIQRLLTYKVASIWLKRRSITNFLLRPLSQMYNTTKNGNNLDKIAKLLLLKLILLKLKRCMEHLLQLRMRMVSGRLASRINNSSKSMLNLILFAHHQDAANTSTQNLRKPNMIWIMQSHILVWTEISKAPLKT